MINEKQILNSDQLDIIINRLSHQLIENHDDFKSAVIIGLQPRGTLFCNKIVDRIANYTNNKIQKGILDISFYRDDFRRREDPIEPMKMEMNLSIESKNVILIDDVLFTGRSVRSAIDALLAFGRPKSVELLVLIDRRFSRHLPIQPNYVGKKVDVIESEKVLVRWKENGDLNDEVIMIKS